METLLDIAFQLYRAAQDTPLEDFEALVLSIMKVLVPFCAAIWLAAEYGRARLRVRRAHLHNAPPGAIEGFASSARALTLAAQVPRRAHRIEGERLLAPLHFGQVLLIADLPEGSSSGNWLALFRSKGAGAFADEELERVALLMPHLSQALALNRTLHVGRESIPQERAAAKRALARADGTLMYCGDEFAQAIRAEYPAWGGTLLPKGLLQKASDSDTLRLGRDNRVRVARIAGALLLTLQFITPAERLSPQQLTVAQLFGAGASYKEIARRVTLAPATVRNVVQVTYRKLGINNKAQLARLMAESYGTPNGAAF